jgi:hypothetical protein
MSRVLVMTYRVRCEVRVAIPETGTAVGDPLAVSRAIDAAVNTCLSGVPNVEPTSVRFRVEEMP